MAIAALAPPPAAGRRAAHVLEPAGRIGFGWQADLWKIGRYGWMSYVAFSPDGRSIASDGATAPDDVSGNVSIWSFPGGRLLRRLPGRATLSPNWLYYVTDREVRRMAGREDRHLLCGRRPPAPLHDRPRARLHWR
jgi:hypothetical protein